MKNQGRVIKIARLKIYFSIFYFMFLLAFIVLGFANKNNVNRNSASICMALDLMEKLDVRKRKETAFVFMDSYIMKGFGGQVLASYLESVQKNPMKICLNCIACGEEVCVGFSKGMRKDAQTLAKAYKANKKIQTKTIQDAQKMHTPFDSLNDVINVSCGSFEEENSSHFLFNSLLFFLNSSFNSDRNIVSMIFIFSSK